MIPQILLALFLASPAQSSFEVASVKVNRAGSAGGEGREGESIVASPGSLTMRNVSLNSCLKWAYSAREFQIVGAPGWFGSERYDISAKSSGPSSEAELRTMLQALLGDRFHLKLRREQRELPVYALVVAKDARKLHLSAAEGAGSMRPGEGTLTFKNVSMADFADRLSKRPFSVERPIVDRTGVDGSYDFELRLADNAADLKRGLEKNDGPSIFDVLPKQLGLKLEPQKGPVDVIVIEHAEKVPVDN